MEGLLVGIFLMLCLINYHALRIVSFLREINANLIHIQGEIRRGR